MSETLVSTDWLAARLGDPKLAVVDASWYMPKTGRDPDQEYLAAHIPGAVRFNIDKVADPDSDLPHTIAGAELFAAEAGEIGISEDMTIVVYDGLGLFSAPRVWWNFRVMGAKDVRVLDGGFPKWEAEHRPTQSGAVKPKPKTFSAQPDRGAVASTSDVRAALDSGIQVVDARSPARFRGEEAEPREGVAPGHIPGAKNVHYGTIIADGRLKDGAELTQIFRAAGVDPSAPMVTTCGSGVSAAILALAVEKMGHTVPRLYDGSWTEWGGDPSTPKARG
ncbi:sulfurtransferase [Terrihabitans soli]|uniref:Sulfurtransferase n=1 Tax=Terrihabitans soli TaxID=708113 RepID=A0A6S6QP86_9HYPH|nr:3-mercaptopyruvate sulfurtransferase [Terrihabitans soli]BCJ90799.1 sulfurtransferase [Terrihabitans soli]